MKPELVQNDHPHPEFYISCLMRRAKTRTPENTLGNLDMTGLTKQRKLVIVSARDTGLGDLGGRAKRYGHPGFRPVQRHARALILRFPDMM